jgi:hypothetical protein
LEEVLVLQQITESWNGTSWTELNDLNTARQNGGCGGTNTAALSFSGTNSVGSPTAQTEKLEWNKLDRS